MIDELALFQLLFSSQSGFRRLFLFILPISPFPHFPTSPFPHFPTSPLPRLIEYNRVFSKSDQLLALISPSVRI
ncbi:MAG: hypothetical protein O9332_10580 [Microcystis sp. LE19-10.1B]|uniref:hypothetical protein n=1 Tax=Microcystis sp. LE19-10.1B TaxID=3016428 RepID=UPI0022C0F621|nr:hypothetical protein [Microcystis sp. LE19-10.1B]MCZ8025847.1 hypothetical protein [Microcystis sp. LE19-10.1B]MCZ8364090.1 hypothetical protein [Microcystis sp. LE19-251.1A]